MRLRRVSALVAAAVAALIAGAAPAMAVGPVYPPGGGSSGSVELWVDQTLVAVTQQLGVTPISCNIPATLTIAGPGRVPGVPTTILPVSDPTVKQFVTFARVGRNTVTLTCANGSATVGVTVKAATPVKVAAASVLGETVQAGTTTSATAAGVGAAVSSGIVATLAHTGASLAPLWIALALLLGGAALLALSRPRRRVAVAASGRHRA